MNMIEFYNLLIVSEPYSEEENFRSIFFMRSYLS